ncbi:conserved protein of unknown function [Magnetospirillum sp. XM-1]|uniref:hypothetical protein n=1 Tax=Magnetospirillum sp. XM-1 TaxID=1663591 RepID=UPI00073DC64A|nr:hypothetical protein [Magnetospirillum sp. XM-1]CUW41616.1 conserved protein of unknown function [Magnetospirillum sp. XM-1]
MIKGKPAALAAALLLLAGPSMAGTDGWVGWCAGPEAAGTHGRSRPVFQPPGERRWLTLGDGIPAEGCRATPIPVAAGQVVWFGPLPDGPGRFERGVSLQGPAGSGGFEVSEIHFADEAPAAPSPPEPMPLGADILPMLDIRPFGTEERAGLERRADQAILSCRPGEQPAGFVLAQPQRTMPPLSGLSVRLKVEGDGGAWWFGLSDAPRQQQQNPLLLGRLDGGAPQLPIPDLSWGEAGFSAMVECPRAGGTLKLSSMELTAAASVQTPLRSAWMWRPAHWRETASSLIEHLVRHDARMVYVTVPVGDGGVEEADRLGAFIAEAGRRGIAVWAVIGDPHAVLPSERPRFEQWAGAYAAYNTANPPDRRLAGLQLDIEPYLLPGYAQDPAAWDAAYVETANAVAQAGAGLPVEAAVPVWFGSASRRERILDRLGPEIQSLAVMDYRTDPRRIVDGAQPFLAWAMARKKGIRIAVEFGPLADEEIRMYRASPTRRGELWRIALDGGDALVLMDQQAEDPAGTPLALAGKSVAPGSALTFHGADARIDDILRALERQLAPWPSFLGMAIHGVD